MNLRENLKMAGLSKLRFVFLSMLSAAFLAACGGAPADNPNYNTGSGGASAETRTIVVSVAGTSGTVLVRLNDDNNLTFNGNGSQEINSYGLNDEVQATIISAPAGESCYFTPLNQQQVIVLNRANVECGTGAVSGKVKNFFTNAEVSGAVITVNSDDGSPITATITGSDGSYSFSAPANGDRTIINVAADGYAPFTSVVAPSDLRPVVIDNIFLVPLNLTDTEDPTADMTFRASGIPVLQIPANGLVTSGGSAPTGNVTAAITLLDPTFSAKVLPARYEVSDGGIVSWAESYGGISFELTDTAGNVLSLAGGVNADLRVPGGASLESDPGAPFVYALNTDTGYWESPIAAATTSFGLFTTFDATVSALSSTFMAGNAYTANNVSGVVIDSNGNPFAGVTVVAQGRDYIGLSYSTTNAEGEFVLPARQNSNQLVYAVAGTQSRTVEATTITTPSTDLEVLLDQNSTTITLTWGENPADLDSHLFGPSGDDSRFHVYFGNKEANVSTSTIFLDIDDVTSFGPEVTTIPSFPLQGRYEFYVKKFSGSSTIQLSPGRVELNLQGENFVFSAPGGLVTDCWHVFDIVVDSSLTGTLDNTNTWVTDSICDAGQVSSGGSSKPQFPLEGTSPAMEAILNKYYAP